MKTKRIFALIISLMMILSLSACKIKIDIFNGNEQTTAVNGNVGESDINSENNVADTTTEQYVQESTTSPETTRKAQTETTTKPNDNPSDWSKGKIVEEYKKSAVKSNATAKSKQKITLKAISVNNGEYDNVFSFISPIIGKFLESNSTEKTGITGGYNNLVEKDIDSAKAYKSGNDTVIEMRMVEQTSGPKEDALSGSVGHAITAVGDISEVVRDLEERGLPLELSEEETKIYYTNPVVKVVINDKGEIISGTWSYTVEIRMNNFKAFGQNVEKASITMENTITV